MNNIFESRFLKCKAEFRRLVRREIARQNSDPAMRITWNLVDNTAYISTGNKKLISDITIDEHGNDGTLFLIYNLPAKKTCPFATAHCAKACYARKAEQNYPDCLPCRERNFDATKDPVFFTAFMIRALHHICNLNFKTPYRDAKHITMRIHESGDFYSIDYMISWFTIADFCKDIKNLDFMAYTKSIQFYDMLYRNGYRKTRRFHVRYSIWNDTDKNDIALAEKHHLPIYTAFDGDMPKGFFECRCEDCGHCRECFSERKKIACKIH